VESAETGRHLAEFWQIDVELPEKKEDAMKTAETMLRDVIKEVVETKSAELERLGRKLKVPKLPLKRLSHAETVKTAIRMGFDTKYGEEIPWDAEKAISLEIGEPFFIMDYPKGSRGFYDKTVGEHQLSFDLIYPEGFGEALSGSEREFDAEQVKKKLVEVGQEPEAYSWFIELLEQKRIRATAGFGFGLERLTRFICGLERIEMATPFPKLPGGDAL
jgi:asparaginyl-tRNA synthetase